MTDLKKQILQLEKKIFLENLYIQDYHRQLRKNTNPKILSALVIGTFFTGFFISRKKSLPQIAGRLATLTFTAKKLYTTAKKYLPFLPFLH